MAVAIQTSSASLTLGLVITPNNCLNLLHFYNEFMKCQYTGLVCDRRLLSILLPRFIARLPNPRMLASPRYGYCEDGPRDICHRGGRLPLRHVDPALLFKL